MWAGPVKDTSQLELATQVDKPFDGDNLAGVIIPEVAMANAFRNLSPSAQIHHRNTGEVSSEIGIPKTLAITWNAFLGNV